MDYSNIPCLLETDVLVAGAGIAGCSAAIASARRGVNTLLVESGGVLGGAITQGHVAPISAMYSKTQKVRFDGIVWDIIRRSEDYAKKYAGATTRFDLATEMYKYSLLTLVNESGAKILFHAFLTDVVNKDNGDVDYVIVATKEGLRKIKAKMFIDTTGDGDLMGKSKADTVIGSEPGVLGTLQNEKGEMNADTPFEVKKDDYSGKVQPCSLMFRMANVDVKLGTKYMNRKLTYKDLGITKEDFLNWEYANSKGFEVTDSDIVPMPQGRVWICQSIHEGEAIVNMSRIIDVNACDALSYSDGELMAGLQLIPIISFLKTFIPGFKDGYIVDSSSSLGVRESRRLVGDYVLTGRDAVSCKKFDDAVAYGSYIIDIHDPTGKRMAIGGHVDGEYYYIPYRTLITSKVKNLGTAGRSISADHVATSSTRIQGTASLTGEAIGAAAAMAVKKGIGLPDINTDELRKDLKAGGMFID